MKNVAKMGAGIELSGIYLLSVKPWVQLLDLPLKIYK
jgi:hypothetical protein